MPTVNRLLQIQHECELRLGVHALTGEYEIIYCLLDAGAMAPKELQTYSRLSSTAFYQALKRLHDLGFVEAEVNPEDRRGLLYRLSPDMRALILNEHKGYLDLVNNYRGTAASGHQLNDYKSFIHRNNGISHLTADFQVLLYLYLKPGISNLELSEIVDVSPTKFNQTLKRLLGLGLIDFSRNLEDNRGKCYYVTDKARLALDDQHRKVFGWVVERLDVE